MESRLTEGVSKYFDRAIDSQVAFSRVAHNFRCDISVHAARGILLKSTGQADAIYASFDQALERVEKQLRRYKRRLRDHHKNNGAGANSIETIPAQSYVLAPEDEEPRIEGEDGDNPVIIAETTTDIATLTVSEAVMRMDLADLPALMFKNKAHGGLNLVYRREDGNIGWVDPRNEG